MEADGDELGIFPYLASREAAMLPLVIDRAGRLELEPGFRLNRTDEGLFLIEYVTSGDFRMQVGGARMVSAQAEIVRAGDARVGGPQPRGAQIGGAQPRGAQADSARRDGAHVPPRDAQAGGVRAYGIGARDARYRDARYRDAKWTDAETPDTEAPVAPATLIDETMSAGQFAVIDCHVPHVFTSETGCRHLYVYYDGPAARPYYDYILAHGGSPVVAPSDPAAAVREISFLVNAIQRHRDVGEAHMAHHLDALLAELAAGVAGAGADANRRSPVVRVRMMIAEYYAEPLTLQRLADAVCMSPFHFAKLFKEETGVTPHRYLIEVRIRQAKFLLSYTSQSVASIADDCGFGSASAFSTAFRREVGMGPQAYRDAVRA